MKITLSENMYNDFMTYCKERKTRNTTIDYNYDHVTDNILTNMFNYMVNHRLTVRDNAASYFYKSDGKNILCYGYSGHSINCRDNIEEMTENLYHEIFCLAEWLARGINSFYTDIVKEYFGRDYKVLIA